MTDTLTLVWKGQNFISSASSNTDASYHITGTNMSIDWGDGTTENLTSNNSFAHTYSNSGTYIITITGDSITSLGTNCFYKCADLISIVIPSSVTSLGLFCFRECLSLKNITIPSSATSIGNACFYECISLTNIIIPLNITRLGVACFNGCTGLTNITIPSSITSIGDACFSGCTDLTSIIFARNTPPTAEYVGIFDYIPTTCKIYVPKGSLSAYTSASNYPSSSTYTYVERDMIEMEKAQIIAHEIFNKLYPVGAIYMTVEDDDPTDLFGGAWEKIEDRFLLCCGDTYSNGATGGSATHTLTTAEMAVHNHTQSQHRHSKNAKWSTGSGSTSAYVNTANRKQKDHYTSYATPTINSKGGGQAHNNMPPYLVVNIWRRLA